ncbi:MAG: thioredoxin [Lachnospiraceae bacterium]|nr:thioredoxin [Lachnospiraceae bacterium]
MKENRNVKRVVAGVVLAVAFSCITVGLARQEQLEVLGKAVNICLECIGIG